MSDTVYSKGQIDAIAAAIGNRIKTEPFIFPLASQFLLDPNEFNGWGELGPYDNANARDLGNVGATTISRVAGGLMFPFDVRLTRFKAAHYNSNANAQAWGWRICHTTPIAGSTAALAATDILRECVGAGATATAPRDYGSTQNQLTDIDLSASATIPAGDIITLGVEAPTAVGTNYWVRICSGYLQLERV